MKPLSDYKGSADLGMEVYVCHPSILEAEAGGSPVQGKLGLPMKTLPQSSSPKKELSREYRSIPRAGKRAQLLKVLAVYA